MGVATTTSPVAHVAHVAHGAINDTVENGFEIVHENGIRSTLEDQSKL